MKVLLIAGHGAGDSGALGCGYREEVLTREIVNLIYKEMCGYVDVEIYDMKRNAYYDVCNEVLAIPDVDYVLEIHFNAYNGKASGTEIYVTLMEKGIIVEEKIMEQLKLFFVLRDEDGVKRKNFKVIYTIKQKGISSALLEVCFIDNEKEMRIYQNNKISIAKSITKGILDGFGIDNKINGQEFMLFFKDKNYILQETMNVRVGPGLEYKKKKKNELTKDGIQNSNHEGCLLKGTEVTVMEIFKKNNQIWGRIPSGWICLQLKDQIFVE